MHNGILKRSILFLIIATLVGITLQIQGYQEDETPKSDQEDVVNSYLRHERIKRAGYRKPGFFRTLFSVVFEQWNDTKNTVGTVNRLVNDNFLPENAPKVETTTSGDPNASTTQAPYKITRSEFNRIIRRNLKGLVRLYNIELQDALKESDRNYRVFKKNASLEVSKFL